MLSSCFFLDAQGYAVRIWGLFFGLHLLVLGYLVYRSGYIPGIVGILLQVTSLSYLAQSFGNILLHQYGKTFTLIGYIGFLEIVFPLWPVIRGVRIQRPAAAEAG
jgi:hypothetical protein